MRNQMRDAGVADEVVDQFSDRVIGAVVAVVVLVCCCCCCPRAATAATSAAASTASGNGSSGGAAQARGQGPLSASAERREPDYRTMLSSNAAKSLGVVELQSNGV